MLEEDEQIVGIYGHLQKVHYEDGFIKYLGFIVWKPIYEY